MKYYEGHSIDRIGKGAAFQRVLPLLGHLAKGERKDEDPNVKRPGKDIGDGFRFSFTDVYPDDVPQTICRHFNITDINTDFVKEIPISLPFEDIFDNLWIGRRETIGSKGAFGHDCQLIPQDMRAVIPDLTQEEKWLILNRVVFEENKKHTEPLYIPPQYTRIVPCDGASCKPIILFRFHIRVDGLENLGVFGISTHSVYDIERIKGQLLYFDLLVREWGFKTGIRHVPLILERNEETITSTTKKGTFRDEKWMMNLKFDPEFLKVFPVFSTMPLISLPRQEQPTYRANISPALISQIIAMIPVIDNQKTTEYLHGILITGVYASQKSLYPVTDQWVKATLMPRLEKYIAEKRAASQNTQQPIHPEMPTEQPKDDAHPQEATN